MSSCADEAETSNANVALHGRHQHPQQQQRTSQPSDEGIPFTGSATASASTGLSAEATISSGEFSDMPSLSSYRSMDDKSASSRGADCDMSLPSLSSYRFDEVSMASSYHSRGSIATNATNHVSCYSEESHEGWGSFSGNVSKSDLSDDEDHKQREEDEDPDEDEFALALEEDLKALQLGRNAGLPPIPSRPPTAIETKSILRNKGEGVVSSTTSSTSQISLTSYGSRDYHNNRDGAIQKGLHVTRSTNSSLDGSVDGDMKSMKASPLSISRVAPKQKTSESATKAAEAVSSFCVDIPKKRTSKSPERGCIDRNESMPMSELQRPIQDPLQKKNSSSSTCRYSADGSSSSLRGGRDSLPRLPRRTSTMQDAGEDNDKGVSAETNSCKESEVVNHEASASDSSSSDGGLSLDIGDNGEDESIDCSVETVDENSVCVDRTKPTNDESLSGSDVTIPSDTEHSTGQHHNAVTLSIPQKQDSPECKPDNRMLFKGDGKELGSKTSAPVAFVTTSTASLDSLDSNRDMGGLSSIKLQTLPMDLTRRTSGTETFGTKSHNGEESGTSGTEADLEEVEENGKPNDDGTKKRNLIRRMSSSLKKAGRSASFRDSFRTIGKTASKIRQRSFRRDQESGASSSPVNQRRTVRNRSSY